MAEDVKLNIDRELKYERGVQNQWELRGLWKIQMKIEAVDKQVLGLFAYRGVATSNESLRDREVLSLMMVIRGKPCIDRLPTLFLLVRVSMFRRYRKVKAVALLKGRWFEVYGDYLRRRGVNLARVVQLGTTVQFGKSLIISLWFDPVDCHDYPCRGYHVISCVDLLFAIYLPRGSRRMNHTTWRRPLREEQRLYAWFVIFCTSVVELTLQITINNGRRREVKYRQSQEVLVDIPERITEHGLSSEITQSPGGSSNTSEGSKTNGSFEVYGRSYED
ncbi:hypothetical protein Tco_0217144 [Tanacetum coccineum]